MCSYDLKGLAVWQHYYSHTPGPPFPEQHIASLVPCPFLPELQMHCPWVDPQRADEPDFRTYCPESVMLRAFPIQRS